MRSRAGRGPARRRCRRAPSARLEREVRSRRSGPRPVHPLGREPAPGRPWPVVQVIDRSVNDIVAMGCGHRPARPDGLPLSVLVGIPLGIFAASGTTAGRLPLDRHLDHRHRHAQLRPGAPAVLRSSASPSDWFPTGGWKGPDTWVLPTIALAGFPIAVIARYTRASMLEVTRKDYIRTAQSKGVGDRSVVRGT